MEKLSISYREDPVVTLNLKDMGAGSVSDVLVIQRSILKLLNNSEDVHELIATLDDNEKEVLLKKYPELGQ